MNQHALVYVIASNAGITNVYVAAILPQHTDTAKHFSISTLQDFMKNTVSAKIIVYEDDIVSTTNTD